PGRIAVPGTDLQRYEAQRLHLERQRFAFRCREMNRRALGVAGARAVAKVDARPAELLDPAVGPHAGRVVERAEAVGPFLHDDDDREVVEAQRDVQPPETGVAGLVERGGRLALAAE